MAELNQRQEKFLKAMLTCSSVEEACRKAEINRNTGYKYLKDETFMTEYRALRRDSMQQVTTRLQELSKKAVSALDEVLEHDESSPNAKVQAAKVILDIAYRALEIDDIQEELENIKRVIGEN